MLQEFGMNNCKPASTPLPQHVSKIPISSTPVDNGFNYRQAVGLLNYLVQCTRPDLSFSWSYLSQFLNSHTLTHQQQFLHVLRYLSQTKSHGITLGGPIQSAMKVVAYSDADHASSNDHRSFTGGVLLMNGPIIWRCTKQAITALSTTEAEHRACSEAGQDTLWASQLLSRLSGPFKVPFPSPSLLCDNQGAIALLENPLYQHRTRHIDVRLNWIRQHISKKNFLLEYVPTDKNLADGLTKPLPPQSTRQFTSGLKLAPLHSSQQAGGGVEV